MSLPVLASDLLQDLEVYTFMRNNICRNCCCGLKYVQMNQRPSQSHQL
jgi:hypothetical protein